MTIRISTGLQNYVMRTGPMDTALAAGYLFMYSGTQPASADAAATGTLLAIFTESGNGATGLTFDDGDNAGEIKKAVAETWQGLGLADNTGRWFRYSFLDTNYATTVTNHALASTTDLRCDGSIGTSGSDMIAASVLIATGAPLTVDTFVLRLPATVS